MIAAAPASASRSRIARIFADRRARGRAALVTYVMGGDPDLAGSEAMALACIEGGADVVEIGVPFSDPVADGPVIQRAGERALAAGTTLSDCLELAGRLRARSDAGIVLMGYLNPMLAYGEDRLFPACARAGVDALIVPDLLPEEALGWRERAEAHGVGTVFLLAPTSTAERRRAVAGAATGFVYFVSVTGVTGARRELPPDLDRQLAAVRAEAPVPVVVGFGVSTPDQARALGSLADGVVVGSAIVARVEEPGSRRVRAERVRKLVRSLRRGLDGAPRRL